MTTFHSIRTPGTARFCQCSPHKHLTIQEVHTTSRASSTTMSLSTSMLTRLTVPCSFPLPSLLHMASHLPQPLPSSHISSSTIESRSTSRPVARLLSSPMSTLALCPFTRRSPIGGTSLSSVRLSESESQRVHVLKHSQSPLLGSVSLL